MTVQAVLFDLDGLLIDSERAAHQTYQELLAPYGASISPDDYATYYIGRTARDGMTQLIGQFGLPITVDEGLDFVRKHDAMNVERGIDLMPGAHELLMWLRERAITTCLATSSEPGRARTVLERHGVWKCFDHVAFGREVEHGKPAPDVFLLAAARTGTDSSHCIVLEDSGNGVRAAHAAGIPVIYVPSMRQPDPDVASLAHAVANSLLDAPSILETM